VIAIRFSSQETLTFLSRVKGHPAVLVPCAKGREREALKEEASPEMEPVVRST
jgi:hypothetical protein